MGSLRVQALTVADIGDEGLTGRFDDPHGYIARNDATWARMLRENPFAQPTDLAILLAVEDRDGQKPAVVGRLGFYAGPGEIFDAAGIKKDFRTFWMDGFFLAEAHRSSGIGGVIMLQGVARCKSLLACGGPSADAQKLYKAAGLKEIGPLKRWVAFNSGIGPARKAFKNTALAAIAAPFASVAARLVYAAKGANATPSRLEFKPVASFSASLDTLVAQAATRPGALSRFARDSRSLNWAMKYRRIKAFEVYEGGELAGYALLKRSVLDATQHGLGTIVVGALLDYFLVNPSRENKRDLVLFTLGHFRRDRGDGDLASEKGRVDVTEFQVFDADFDAICKGFGLLHAGGLRVLFRPAPTAPMADATKWTFTHATSDMLLMTP
jgi:GNAT superfamily N-acetyltransferase